MKCKHIKGNQKKCKEKATDDGYCTNHYPNHRKDADRRAKTIKKNEKNRELTKKKDLTIKQRKWVRLYIKIGNATEAAMLSYDCKNRDVARSIGAENLAKLAFSDLMEQMGLTDIVLMNVGAEGLQAKKMHGSGDSYVEVDDFAVRHRYWETLLKLKGKLTDKPTSLTQINIGHPSWVK